MEVEVTQAHIDAGIKDNIHKCPVANAVKDALNARWVEVGNNTQPHWVVRTKLPNHRFILPKYVVDLIENFDEGGIMTPFTLQLIKED